MVYGIDNDLVTPKPQRIRLSEPTLKAAAASLKKTAKKNTPFDSHSQVL